MVSSLLVFVLLVFGIIHFSCGSLFSTTDNNGIQKTSQYLVKCCDTLNLKKSFIFQKDNGVTSFILCPSTLPDNCPEYNQQNLTDSVSCSDILLNYPDATCTSGYYNLTITNGSIISIYCDMEGNNCGEEGGWTRIAFVNMNEPGTTCPTGLTEGQYDNITLCGLNHTALDGTYDPVCSSTFFSTYGLNYSKVCGQVRGYQYGYAEGFVRHYYYYNYNLSDPYLTGVSITYDDNPIKHIWSYVCGLSEYDYHDFLDCPCNTGNSYSPPSFINNDYYCESGYNDLFYFFGNLFSSNDTLWDGQQRNGDESSCSTTPNMPWFIKTLNETVSDDIQLRVCGGDNDVYHWERFSTPLDLIELYIK